MLNTLIIKIVPDLAQSPAVFFNYLHVEQSFQSKRVSPTEKYNSIFHEINHEYRLQLTPTFKTNIVGQYDVNLDKE